MKCLYKYEISIGQLVRSMLLVAFMGCLLQIQAQDKIYLKDGRVYACTIVEEIPPISLVRIETYEGEPLVFDLKEVLQIFRGPANAGSWDRITLKEGAVITGFITEYSAGREVKLQISKSKKNVTVLSYLEIDKIERITIEEASIEKESKRRAQARYREKYGPRQMRYVGAYGISFWDENGSRTALITNQMLMYDLSKRYAIGMGMGFDVGLGFSDNRFLIGNSFFVANRFFFPKEKTSPYLLLDPGWDFVREGAMMSVGGGLRIHNGNTRLNFNLSLKLQQTDVFGNARNTLSVPDPPQLMEMIQFKVVLE